MKPYILCVLLFFTSALSSQETIETLSVENAELSKQVSALNDEVSRLKAQLESTRAELEASRSVAEQRIRIILENNPETQRRRRMEAFFFVINSTGNDELRAATSSRLLALLDDAGIKRCVSLLERSLKADAANPEEIKRHCDSYRSFLTEVRMNLVEETPADGQVLARRHAASSARDLTWVRDRLRWTRLLEALRPPLELQAEVLAQLELLRWTGLWMLLESE